MVDIVRQLCIKSHESRAKNGDYFKAQQGMEYTTTVSDKGKDVIVFSNFWVSVPKENFVPVEKEENDEQGTTRKNKERSA